MKLPFTFCLFAALLAFIIFGGVRRIALVALAFVTVALAITGCGALVHTFGSSGFAPAGALSNPIA